VSERADVRWWEEPERLDDAELRALVRAATSVLARRGDAPESARDVSRMPRSVIVRELRMELRAQATIVDPDAVAGLVDGELARESACAVLREVGRDANLRAAIDDAYRAADDLMFVDPATLAVAGLVLLAMKVRRVRVGKEGVDVQFDPVKEGVVARLLELVGT
jgi:hypothetical protein